MRGVARFLDLEAASDDGSYNSDSTDEYDDDFVDTNTHDQPSQAAVEMSSNYRFSVESDASDLERVAQSYAEKARQQLRAKDDEVAAGTHVDRMVCRMTGSPDIWLIRVKRGNEKLASTEITFRLKTRIDAREHEQAFSTPWLKGRLYVASYSWTTIVNVCKGLPYILTLAKAHPLTAADGDMVLAAIEQSGPPNYNAGDWIQLRKGSYKGDPGIVTSVSPSRDRLKLAVVPRRSQLQSNGNKRKRPTRPSRALFNLQTAIKTQGVNAVQIKDDGELFTLDNELYTTGGLRIICAGAVTDVKAASPDIGTLHQFAIAGLDPGQEASTLLLRLHDTVKVNKGGMAGAIAVVLDIQHNIARIGLYSDSDNVEVEESVRNLERVFTVGDYVIVKIGPFAGACGFVVEVTEHHLHIGNSSNVNPLTIVRKNTVQTAEPDMRRTRQRTISTTAKSKFMKEAVNKQIYIFKGQWKGMLADIVSIGQQSALAYIYTKAANRTINLDEAVFTNGFFYDDDKVEKGTLLNQDEFEYTSTAERMVFKINVMLGLPFHLHGIDSNPRSVTPPPTQSDMSVRDGQPTSWHVEESEGRHWLLDEKVNEVLYKPFKIYFRIDKNYRSSSFQGQKAWTVATEFIEYEERPMSNTTVPYLRVQSICKRGGSPKTERVELKDLHPCEPQKNKHALCISGDRSGEIFEVDSFVRDGKEIKSVILKGPKHVKGRHKDPISYQLEYVTAVEPVERSYVLGVR